MGARAGISPASGALQQPRQQEDDDSLAQPEPEKGELITLRGDQVADRDHCQRGTDAIAARGEAYRQATVIRKPFHRVADEGGIDRAGAGARHGAAQVEHLERPGKRVDDPAERHKKTACGDNHFRPESIGKPAVDRCEPGLERDEDTERHLDRGNRPLMVRCHRVDEIRPTVLVIGDQDHANDPDDQHGHAIGTRLSNWTTHG